MHLKDFRPDNPDFDAEEEKLEPMDRGIPESTYHQEINSLKIDKLSNRVTIISIIIPCLIGAILIFAYLDMKERVVDVDLTKQNQVERISQQVDEKINTLDVKVAKNRYDLDNTLPELKNKSISLEGQIAKLFSVKADTNTVENQFAKFEKRIVNNANQGKSTLQTMERINKETLSTIKKNQDQFDKNTTQIKEEITLFKEEFDARLLELSDYEQQIGELRKKLSLLDKKYKGIEQENISHLTRLKDLDTQVETLNQKLAADMSRLRKDLDRLSNLSSSRESTPEPPTRTKPLPQINIDSSKSVTIEEESLTQ